MKYQKVLLADGHQGVLGGVRALLENSFDMVFMVADEISLCEAAEKIHPDLIIVDLSLQTTGKINIVRSVKKKFPRIRLIVLSIYDEKTAVDECRDAGADAFVLKRRAVDDLIPAIHAVLGSSGSVFRSFE